jgi:hypothetical protein
MERPLAALQQIVGTDLRDPEAIRQLAITLIEQWENRARSRFRSAHLAGLEDEPMEKKGIESGAIVLVSCAIELRALFGFAPQPLAIREASRT